MDVQWGGENVWKVGDRMFAVRSPEGGFSFKASDIAFEALTAHGLVAAKLTRKFQKDLGLI